MLAPWNAARRILSTLGITEPPIRLAPIARAFGFSVRYVPMDEWDGIHLGNGMILINDSMPLTRKRFTQAHEMGHRILGHTGLQFSSFDQHIHVNNENSHDEKAANRFAVELLMPSIFIRRDWEGRPLEEMAQRYLVSPETMFYRLQSMGCRGA